MSCRGASIGLYTCSVHLWAWHSLMGVNVCVCACTCERKASYQVHAAGITSVDFRHPAARLPYQTHTSCLHHPPRSCIPPLSHKRTPSTHPGARHHHQHVPSLGIHRMPASGAPGVSLPPEEGPMVRIPGRQRSAGAAVHCAAHCAHPKHAHSIMLTPWGNSARDLCRAPFLGVWH